MLQHYIEDAFMGQPITPRLPAHIRACIESQLLCWGEDPNDYAIGVWVGKHSRHVTCLVKSVSDYTSSHWFIEVAEGFDLDSLGARHGCLRRAAETDVDYRIRILATLLSPERKP
jgi:hypothetical protein